MKKQIFILILALFAGTTVFGQIKNTDPKVSLAPSCTGDASKPAVGEPYTYSVTIPTAYAGYNGDGTFNWYVTTNVDLLSGTGKEPGTSTKFTVASGAGLSAYDATTGTAKDIKITWNAVSIGVPYYLVVKYSELNTDGSAACTTENLKVYRIEPQNTFWLDINPSNDLGVVPATLGTSYDVCASTVKTAVVTESGATTSTVETTYNNTVLYAVIKAAGYTGNWDATLKISNLVDDQAVTGITWTAGAVNGTFTCSGTCTNGNGTYTSATQLPATNAGTDILVAITIANNHHEGLTDQGVKISIDGQYTAGTVTYNDKYDGATNNCIDQPADADFVTETIKARPGVNPSNPTNFVTPSTLQRP